MLARQEETALVKPEEVPGPGESPLDEKDFDKDIVFTAGQLQQGYFNLSSLVAEEYDDGTKLPMKTVDARRLERWLRDRVYGYQMALVMFCAGKRCPFIDQCPLAAAKLPLPTGKPCAWEAAIFKQRVSMVCSELKIKQGAHDQILDYSMVRDLVGNEMLMERVGMEIAKDPRSIKTEPALVAQGVPLSKENINQRQIFLDMLGRRKLQLLEALVATRKEKIKAGTQTGVDPSTFVTDLLRRSKEKVTNAKVIDRNQVVEVTIDDEAPAE